MFGVQFEGHPDLKRILMPDDWQDIPCVAIILTEEPVEFKHGVKPKVPSQIINTQKLTKYSVGNYTYVKSQQRSLSLRKRRNHGAQLGPQHPSTHGVLRLKLRLDGEVVLSAEPVIGYLHTGVEKECETRTYHQVFTLIDRLDYLSGPAEEQAFAGAVERLMNVKFLNGHRSSA